VAARFAAQANLLVDQRETHVGVRVHRVRRDRDLVVPQRHLVATLVLEQRREVQVRFDVVGIDHERALEADPRARDAVLVEVDRSQVAVRVRKIRIALERALVGFDRLGVRAAIRVELAALLEPLDGCLAERGIGLGRGERNRHTCLERRELEHELTIGLDEHALVPHNHATRSVEPGPQRAERPIDFGDALAQRIDAAADPTQRYPPIEQRQHRANGDQIAKLELTILAGRIVGGPDGGRLQQRGALPVPQPRSGNSGNPRDIAERVGPHRAREYIVAAATSSKIARIAALDCSGSARANADPFQLHDGERAQTPIHSGCTAVDANERQLTRPLRQPLPTNATSFGGYGGEPALLAGRRSRAGVGREQQLEPVRSGRTADEATTQNRVRLQIIESALLT
jgi:hypothetical protein